jgi:hypothetical protein
MEVMSLKAVILALAPPYSSWNVHKGDFSSSLNLTSSTTLKPALYLAYNDVLNVLLPSMLQLILAL